MNTLNLLIKLSKRFPRSIAKKYHDHVGLMTGKLPKEVNKIFICLDFDEFLFDEIKEFNPDIIFTHHPFIYGNKKKVFKADSKKEMLVHLLDELNIPVYSMHTNFDEGKGGMNDALACALELNNIYAPQDNLMMRIGYLDSEKEIHEFAKYAKDKLHVKYGLLIASGPKMIKKVAILGGGGSKDYPTAYLEGADIYISGDISHHTRRELIRYNRNYLDLPHEIEKIFIPTLKDILLNIDPTLIIKTSDHEKEPEVI